MTRRQLVQCGCQKTLMGSSMCRHLPNAPNDQPYPAIFGLKVKARLPSWTSARRTEAPATTVAQHGPNSRVSEPVCRHRLARPHSHEAAGGPMTSHPSARCRIDSARSVGASANGFSCFGPSAGAPDKEPDGSLGGRIATAVPFGQTGAQSEEHQRQQRATNGAARPVGRIVPVPAQTPTFPARSGGMTRAAMRGTTTVLPFAMRLSSAGTACG